MKIKNSHKFLALMLGICMVFSMVVPTIAALPETGYPEDVNNDGDFNYVAIGDSVTNGYGLDGYFYQENGKKINSYGFRRYVPSSYPAVIAEILEEKTGLTVNLDPMAISGIRYSDLRAILDEDWQGDSYHGIYAYTWVAEAWINICKDIVNNGGELSKYDDPNGTVEKHFNKSLTNEYKLEILREEYTTSIGKADLVSIDLGTNDFGTYLTDRLMDYVEGDADFDGSYQSFDLFLDPVTKETLRSMVQELVMEAEIPSAEQMSPVIVDLIDTLLYGIIGFCSNYDACMELIYEINPDVQVMVIDAYNMMTGIKIDTTGVFPEGIDISSIISLCVDISNFYVRELSPYATKVLHVDIPVDEYPEVVMDYFNDFDGWANFDDKEEKEAKDILHLLLEELMGESPEWPAMASGIPQIDAIEEDISGFIKDQVVDLVVYGNDDQQGVSDAVELVETLIETLNNIYETSADGLDTIDNAVEGVNMAKDLVNTVITTEVMGDTLPNIVVQFDGGFLEGTVRSAIRSTVSDMMAENAGLLPENISVDYIADLVYDVAYDYGTAEGEEAKAAVVKDAVKQVIIIAQDCDEGYAEMAYNLVNAFESGAMDVEKYVSALTVYLSSDYGVVEGFGDLDMPAHAIAQIIYVVGEAYRNEAIDSGTDRSVMSILLEDFLGDEAKAELAVALYYDVYNTMKVSGDFTEDDLFAVTVGCAIANQLFGVSVEGYMWGTDDDTAFKKQAAQAMYNVYVSVEVKDELATNEDLNMVLFMVAIQKNVNPNVHNLGAVYNCYINNFDDDDLVDTVTFLLHLNGQGTLVNAYNMYHSFPFIMSEIAQGTTVYLGTFLPYLAGQSLDFDGIAAQFMAGTLMLTPPVEGVESTYGIYSNYADALAAYRHDSTLLTVFIRFLSLTGLFIHPNSTGHQSFVAVIEEYLDEFVIEEEPESLPINRETEINNMPEYGAPYEKFQPLRILSIGDELVTSADGEKSYTGFKDKDGDPLTEALEVTELSIVGARVNDILSLFTGEDYDDYTAKVLSSVDVEDSTLKDNDVVFINAGANNIAFCLKAFADPDLELDLTNIGILNCSEDLDGLLLSEKLEGLFAGDDNEFINIAKAFLYGYFSFADQIEELIIAVREANPDAKIVLMGLPDLIEEGSEINNGMGMRFAFDLLIEKLVSDFNQQMIFLAEKYDLTFMTIDANALNTDGSEQYALSLPTDMANPEKILAAMNATRLTDPHEDFLPNLGKIFLCYVLEIHGTANFYEARNEAEDIPCGGEGEVTYKCDICGQDVTVTRKDVTEDVFELETDDDGEPIWYWFEEAGKVYIKEICNIPSCGKEHKIYADLETEVVEVCGEGTHYNYTATVTYGGEVYEAETTMFVEEELAHAYGEPEWVWEKDEETGLYTKATVTLTCERDEEHTVSASTEEFEVEIVTAPTCSGAGEHAYTANIEIDGETYSNTNPDYVVVGALAHTYGEPEWTWNEDLTEADAVFECSACEEGVDGHVLTVSGVITSEITLEPTCTEKGEETFTASVVLGGKTYTDEVVAEADYADHEFVDGKCECGAIDPDARPNEEGECCYVTEEELDADGRYTLTLDGEEVGEYLFLQFDGGWLIANENDETLIIENGELVYGDAPYVWTFENGVFTAVEVIEKITPASGNFWNGLFGGEDKVEIIETQYYLVFDGEELTLSESITGADAEFSIHHCDDRHSFDDGVVTEPTCDEGGFTLFTCEKCGLEVVFNETEPQHTYEDGVCIHCGAEEEAKGDEGDDDDEEEDEEDNFCIYFKEFELEEDGTYMLSINGEYINEYYFAEVEKEDDEEEDGLSYWTIVDPYDDTYVSFYDGYVVYSDEEFIWTYDEEKGYFFYEDVKTETTSGNFWMGLFGDSTKEITTTYYLVSDYGYFAVSESDDEAEAFFGAYVLEEHVFEGGVCVNCGRFEDHDHDHDECVYYLSVELEEDGKFLMYMDGLEAGEFDFVLVDEEENLWTIEGEEGFVAYEDGKVVYSEEEFLWFYDEEEYSFVHEVTETVTQSGNFWMGLFGDPTKTTTIRYYLALDEDGEEFTTAKVPVYTEFIEEVTTVHEYYFVAEVDGYCRYDCWYCAYPMVVPAE